MYALPEGLNCASSANVQLTTCIMAIMAITIMNSNDLVVENQIEKTIYLNDTMYGLN